LKLGHVENELLRTLHSARVTKHQDAYAGWKVV